MTVTVTAIVIVIVIVIVITITITITITIKQWEASPQLHSSGVFGNREKRGGLHLVECEYKSTKIKAAMKFYQNMDPSMKTVQNFKERVVGKGHTSLMKKAHISLLSNWA